MSDLDRALRAAFALDDVPEPPPGFDARMARAARGRAGRMPVAPLALAALVAGAAAATFAIGRDVKKQTAPVAATRAAGMTPSIGELREIVVRARHGWRWSWRAAEDEVENPPPPAEPPPPRPAPQRAPHARRGIDQVDCGDDPLCPLVAPSAARLSIAVSEGPARVSLDGQDAGNAPLDIDVIPGEHMLVIRWEDGRQRKVFATLRSGDRRSISVARPERPRPAPR